jgi:hypothetical protein
MATRKLLLAFNDDHEFPSDEELTKLADELFVMFDKEEEQGASSTNVTEKL